MDEQLAALRLCARDYVRQCITEGLDPLLVGLSMVAAGADVINTVAGPGAALCAADQIKDRVSKANVAPDGKTH